MIQGQLVNLRAPSMDDLERNMRWVNDREVMRFLVLRYPMPELAEEAWLRNHTGEPMSFGDVFLAIETKEGRHVGNCGLHHASPENRTADLGIMIGEKDCWDRGYGSDAVRTLLRFGFEEMNLHRIALTVYPFNERAVASYAKCGFVDEGRMREWRYQEGAYHDVIWMAVLRDDWAAAR